MIRTGLARIVWTLALLTLTVMLLAPPVNAQGGGRRGGGGPRHEKTDGEPTDPDEAFRLLAEAEVDLEEWGISVDEPKPKAEADAWWQLILDVLVTLGLMEEDPDQ